MGLVGSTEALSSMELALAQDILREKIIDYAITNEYGGLCGKTIGKIRLLQKSWQISVSKLLTRNHESLYNLTLNHDNSLNGTPFVNLNGKLLDQFVKLVQNRIEERFPTFRLKIDEDFFQLENYDSFYNFLRQCGQGLVELDLIIPYGGGSLPCIFFNVNFPNLWKMRVTFTDTDLEKPANVNSAGESANAMLLMQTFLNRNESLNEFVLSQESDIIPDAFEYITLPPSITILEISQVITGTEAEVITRSSLPNLTTLQLYVPDVEFPEGLISRVLERTRETLRTLYFTGEELDGPANFVNLVIFPVMKKLEVLDIDSRNLELESDTSSFDLLFPKLKSLRLCDQTRNMFFKWTAGSPANNITEVTVQLVDDTVYKEDVGHILPMYLEDMQRIHLTFPNITSLTLWLSGEQICGIQYLFLEMKQLTWLCLIVADHELTLDSDNWDSILTGIPVEIISGMRARQDFWEFLEFKTQKLPSIRMLTELQTLSLESAITNEDREFAVHESCPMISDATFEFAFKKMDTLKNLYFRGRFRASAESTANWENLGRTITYEP